MPIIINGRYSSATVYTTENTATALDTYARVQLQTLCDNEVSAGSTIRVMPDVHPGKVCTIGLTMTIGKSIMPEILGLDIGCGVSVAKVRGVRKEWQKLDSVIREHIPSGFERRTAAHRFADSFDFAALLCARHIRQDVAKLSLGTLGGGNHFIEADADGDGNHYLLVHSGSRHLGAEISAWYLSAGHRELAACGKDVPYELTYLEGELMADYLADVEWAAAFASLNRAAIVSDICKAMKWKVEEQFESVHNYVDFSGTEPLLRKGAISAKSGERLVIPVNMRDGALLGTGLGNADWNCSAPHGSGRILKREDARKSFTVSSFKKEMRGIYSSCIAKGTLDEAPFAYRPMEEIRRALAPTVRVDRVLTPLYNFKAGGGD